LHKKITTLKMEAKKCQYCNGEITGKRDDAKFCSSTCKAKHWEEKKLVNKISLPVQRRKKYCQSAQGSIEWR